VTHLRAGLAGAAAGAAAGFLARDLFLDSFASAWAVGALAGAAAAAAGWPRALAAACLLLAVLWTGVAFTPLAAGMAAGLVRRDPAGGADAVLVLASRLQRDGEPTAAALSRLGHGAALARAGAAPRIVLTADSPASRRVLPEVEVVVVGPVRSTRDEAVRAAALCRERGWRRLLVVTAPLHSRRACAAVEHEGPEVICAPSPETRYDLETLDRPVERLGAFRDAVHERLGLWLYARRGWISERPRRPAARPHRCRRRRRSPSRWRTGCAWPSG
jgi:uncharacterized SAM-binding protein YcdF (DUF218 family)